MHKDGTLGYSRVYFQGHADNDALASFVQLFLAPADGDAVEVVGLLGLSRESHNAVGSNNATSLNL